MNEYPILFSTEMVKAILDGRKTQMRRVMRPQPYMSEHPAIGGEIKPCLMWQRAKSSGTWMAWESRNWKFDLMINTDCPYGQPGDRLWVRETFAIEHQIESDQTPPHNDGRPIKLGEAFGGTEWRQCHYRATDPVPDLMYEDHPRDEPHCRWTPSIHMPRWASRIILEVTGVRVERVKDITWQDIAAEGCPPEHHMDNCNGISHAMFGWFGYLWDSINAKRGHSWDSNPWVWVVEFRAEQS